MPFTTYLSNKVLDHTIGKTAYTMPTIYLSLHAGSPTISGTGGTEANYTSFARIAVPGSSWASASGQANATSAIVNFVTPTGAAGQAITHCTVWDASTGGNMTEFYPITGGGFTTAVSTTIAIALGQFTRTLV